MRKHAVVIASSITITISAITLSFALADSDEHDHYKGTIPVDNVAKRKYPDLATISLQQAIEKALSETNGKILKVELEDENGFLVYGLEVVTSEQNISDIKVDAGTGKIYVAKGDDHDEEDHDD